MEELVKIAMNRLDNLDVELTAMASRKDNRLLKSRTFAENIYIIRTHAGVEDNLLLDNYLEGMNINYKNYMIKNFPWARIEESYDLQKISQTELIEIILYKLSINQSELARRLNISKVMLHYLIKRKRNLKVGLFLKLVELGNLNLKIKHLKH